jgi:hypothetical protein
VNTATRNDGTMPMFQKRTAQAKTDNPLRTAKIQKMIKVRGTPATPLYGLT